MRPSHPHAQDPRPPSPPSARLSYELTFKKDHHQRYFATQPQPQSARALFQPTSPLLACIAQPLEQYHRKSMEELASLPFADLMSAQLEPCLSEKVSLIGVILQLKRMRIKMRSAGLNIHCLRAREAASHEDKHRLFLLELLWKQLGKKIFLEALRLNLATRKYQQAFAEPERRAPAHQPEGLQSELEESQENSYGLWEQAQSSEEEQGGENIREKLMILAQGVSHTLRKTLFFAFNRIAQSGEAGGQPNSDCESIPLASKPNINQSQEDDEEEEDQREYENATPRITFSKLGELESLIENLHEYCADNSDDLLRKYFVKWKISLLEAIAHSQLQQLAARPPSLQEEREIEEQEYGRASRASAVSRESRLTSQLSEAGRSLKSEKRALKELLRSSAIRSFYCKLRDHAQLRKIEALCLSIRRQGILRSHFEALRLNAQDQRMARQMAAYYQAAAENQLEDDGTSKLFHKTNLLCCYFSKLKDHRRNQRMARAISETALRLCFRRLVSFAHMEKKHLQLAARHVEKSRKRLMFKCFQAWRQDFLSENCYSARFRQYVKAKERETLQHCFSILKVQFKRALLRLRKAEQHYCGRLTASAFQAMQTVHEQSKQLGQRSELLQSCLFLRRGRQFVGRFRQYYSDFREYQRFSMREERLRRTLLRLHALQAVKGWRSERLKRQAYAAIELKLARLRERQRKREVLEAWAGRARAGGRGGSEGHKAWLVRYYGGLCGVLPAP